MSNQENKTESNLAELERERKIDKFIHLLALIALVLNFRILLRDEHEEDFNRYRKNLAAMETVEDHVGNIMPDVLEVLRGVVTDVSNRFEINQAELERIQVEIDAYLESRKETSYDIEIDLPEGWSVSAGDLETEQDTSAQEVVLVITTGIKELKIPSESMVKGIPIYFEVARDAHWAAVQIKIGEKFLTLGTLQRDLDTEEWEYSTWISPEGFDELTELGHLTSEQAKALKRVTPDEYKKWYERDVLGQLTGFDWAQADSRLRKRWTLENNDSTSD